MAKYWEGKLIRLRGIEPDDADTHFQLDQEDDISRFQWVMNPPVSRAATRKWIEQASTSRPGAVSFTSLAKALATARTCGSSSTLPCPPGMISIVMPPRTSSPQP